MWANTTVHDGFFVDRLAEPDIALLDCKSAHEDATCFMSQAKAEGRRVASEIWQQERVRLAHLHSAIKRRVN